MGYIHAFGGPHPLTFHKTLPLATSIRGLSCSTRTRHCWIRSLASSNSQALSDTTTA